MSLQTTNAYLVLNCWRFRRAKRIRVWVSMFWCSSSITSYFFPCPQPPIYTIIWATSLSQHLAFAFPITPHDNCTQWRFKIIAKFIHSVACHSPFERNIYINTNQILFLCSIFSAPVCTLLAFGLIEISCAVQFTPPAIIRNKLSIV